MGTAKVLEVIKQSSYFNWLLHADTDPRIKTVVGIVAAGIGAFGIHYEWNEAARTLTFMIPTMGEALHHGWDVFIQFAIQEYVYRTGLKAKA